MISRSSEYAIRALTWLAQHDNGRHHLARDMAKDLRIPAPFLGKVLQPLVARGILCSRRGKSGGFKLDRAAKDIALVEIVEAQETLVHENACLLGQSSCSDANPCPLHETWARAARSIHERLRQTTLQDMIDYRAAHAGCAYPFQIPEPGRPPHDRSSDRTLPA